MRASDRILESSVTLTKNLRSREEEDKVSSCALIQAMAKACQVSGTLDSGLTESEVPYESETHFTEEQELEQLIHGHLCCKIYPFSGGKILVICPNETLEFFFSNFIWHLLPLMM
jgi:hypothetical protein